MDSNCATIFGAEGIASALEEAASDPTAPFSGPAPTVASILPFLFEGPPSWAQQMVAPHGPAPQLTFDMALKMLSSGGPLVFGAEGAEVLGSPQQDAESAFRSGEEPAREAGGRQHRVGRKGKWEERSRPGDSFREFRCCLTWPPAQVPQMPQRFLLNGQPIAR